MWLHEQPWELQEHPVVVVVLLDVVVVGMRTRAKSTRMSRINVTPLASELYPAHVAWAVNPP